MARNLVAPVLCGTVADIAVFDGAKMFDGTIAMCAQIGTSASAEVITTPGTYRFVAGSVSPDNNQSQLVVVPGTNPGSGKWIRCDQHVDLILPITFATADAAVLATIPAELTLYPDFQGPMWEMITAWAGGVASAIGLSWTNQSKVLEQGSLLGGAGGDTTFPTRSFYRGTAGQNFTVGLKRIVLNPTATINFDRVISAFTSGTGNAHVPCSLISAPIIPVNPG